MIYKALRSAGGLRRTLRSLREELNKMRMTESLTEVHGFRCKLAACNAKSSMVPQNNPDVACMDEIERTERKSSVHCPLREGAFGLNTNAVLTTEWECDQHQQQHTDSTASNHRVAHVEPTKPRIAAVTQNKTNHTASVQCSQQTTNRTTAQSSNKQSRYSRH